MGSSLLTFRAGGNRCYSRETSACASPYTAGGERSEVSHVGIRSAIGEEFALHAGVALVAALATVAAVNFALAQPSAKPSLENGATCPPDTQGEPPTVGGGSSAPLSDKLAQSKGVICPPAGVDPKMQVAPPSGGRLKIIPPPGTPGGNPNVQPK
jgi:hypothetical protein